MRCFGGRLCRIDSHTRVSFSFWFRTGFRFEIISFIVTRSRRRFKPAIAAGRWCFDGGAAKSDCVEMAVREVVDLILWDDDKAAFNLDWLPRTAMGALREL